MRWRHFQPKHDEVDSINRLVSKAPWPADFVVSREPKNTSGAVVVVRWSGREYLMDGRRRINHWNRNSIAGSASSFGGFGTLESMTSTNEAGSREPRSEPFVGRARGADERELTEDRCPEATQADGSAASLNRCAALADGSPARLDARIAIWWAQQSSSRLRATPAALTHYGIDGYPCRPHSPSSRANCSGALPDEYLPATN
jgi:hypothetical protein